MSSNRFTKIILLALSAVLLSVASPSSSARAEIIDLDISAVNPQFANAFLRAEAFWDARVLGYSNTLPNDIQAQLTGGLLIFAATGPQDSELLGGALGRAGPTVFPNIVRGNIFRGRQVAVPTVAMMVFADEFFADSTEDEITDVIIHEMGHALGIGSLWTDNGLLQQIGPGPLQYVGENARRAFAIEAGVSGLGRTGFVPIEQQGGPGTALAHWDDDSPTFNTIALNNRIELMTGFFIPNTTRFISRTTLASLVDIHYVVRGFNEDELIQFPRALANQLAPPVPLTAASQGLSGFSSNPFGANEALRSSSPAIKPRKTVNVYKKRRR